MTVRTVAKKMGKRSKKSKALNNKVENVYIQNWEKSSELITISMFLPEAPKFLDPTFRQVANK